MRVRRLQSLAWIGNVLVLAGAAWAGSDFVRSTRTRATTPNAEWPAAAEPIEIRRSVGLPGLETLVATPVNGRVPPATEGTVVPPPPTDEEAFRAKLRIVGGILGSSETTSIQFTFDGKPLTLRLAERIDSGRIGWRFVDFVYDEASGGATAVFRADGEDVSVTQQSTLPKQLTEEESARFSPEYAEDGLIDPSAVREDRIGREAYFRPSTGEWHVTPEEFLWWETYGESAFLSKLVAESVTDAEGRPRGLRLVTLPKPQALAGGRGIEEGDVLRSINTVPMNDLEDVAGYLRGGGRGLERYEVLIERAGAERTIVYRVARPTAVSGRL